MGILNVTPDSFSDGGRFDDPTAAIAHGRALAADGADWVDVGGESTRPGAQPVPEAEELALIYQAKGFPREDARRLARTLIADPERALDTLAREELGLNPDELGSPWGAAISSFLAFAVGAVIPLLPFLLASEAVAFPASIGLAAAALFGVGAALSFFTGRNALMSGLRMLAIGAAAGAATYGIGALVGVTVG